MAAEDKSRVLLLLVRDILEEVVDCSDAAALLEEDINKRCIISIVWEWFEGMEEEKKDTKYVFGSCLLAGENNMGCMMTLG